ncbi:MAG: flagellar hook-basal body complex protein FliE [Oscillospiraceae bacterium]|nr:flagellar hook-basal body complex protein FliE [Oscillospiraceae bacterium]
MEFTTIGQMQKMESMSPMLPMSEQDRANLAIKTESISFLDIFRGMVDNVIETNEQVDRDAIDVMLGNIDNTAEVQANIQKAGVAVDLLVTVKNEVLSAYNTLINMQI